MKDPQQINHEAWQASPCGRSWQAEAERGCHLARGHPEHDSGAKQEAADAGEEK